MTGTSWVLARVNEPANDQCNEGQKTSVASEPAFKGGF